MYIQKGWSFQFIRIRIFTCEFTNIPENCHLQVFRSASSSSNEWQRKMMTSYKMTGPSRWSHLLTHHHSLIYILQTVLTLSESSVHSKESLRYIDKGQPLLRIRTTNPNNLEIQYYSLSSPLCRIYLLSEPCQRWEWQCSGQWVRRRMLLKFEFHHRVSGQSLRYSGWGQLGQLDLRQRWLWYWHTPTHWKVDIMWGRCAACLIYTMATQHERPLLPGQGGNISFITSQPSWYNMSTPTKTTPFPRLAYTKLSTSLSTILLCGQESVDFIREDPIFYSQLHES